MIIEYLRKFIKRIEPDCIFIKRTYRKKFNRKINLKRPATFNEKIQWLKLFDRTHLHTICSDKFLVRDYVEKKIGKTYLIELIFHTKDANLITQDILPNEPFIIKTNHNSGGNLIFYNKSNIDLNQIRRELTEWLNQDYYITLREWQYKKIKPQILIEKLLLDENSQIPSDFKFFCFNGHCEFIQVDISRFSCHKRNFYDRNWNLMDFRLIYDNGEHIPMPSNFSEMIRIAETLASDFIFARIDLYNVKHKIYFGEITFHPEGGFGTFIPTEYDEIIGNLLKITEKR